MPSYNELYIIKISSESYETIQNERNPIISDYSMLIICENNLFHLLKLKSTIKILSLIVFFRK